MKTSFLFVLLVSSATFLAAQTYITETETHIFWQPERKLKADDFQNDGSASPNLERYKESGIATDASLGLWSVVDVPNKKLRRKGILAEKIYFAPAFEKATSIRMDQNDSMGILYQQLFYDAIELCARKSRKELQEYQDTHNKGGTGMKAIMYMTVKENNQKLYNNIISSINKYIYRDKDPQAYSQWRKTVDELLEQLKDFATTAEECHRFAMKKPIEENYVKATALTGPLKKGDSLMIVTVDPKRFGRKTK